MLTSIKKFRFSKLNHFPVLEIIFLTLFGLNLINQLFLEPIIGLANNADFYRIMDWFGLGYLSSDPDQLFFYHINRVFAISEAVGPGQYVTSELLFVKLALTLDQLFTQDAVFNILFLGGVHAFFYLTIIGLVITNLRPFPVGVRLSVYSLVFLIFGDVGYVAYFNSLYSEPASLLFIGLSVGLAFYITRQAQSLRHPNLWIMTYFGAVLLFAIAKPQNTVTAVPFALLGIILAWLPTSPPRSKARLLLAMGLALAVLGVSARQVRYGQPLYLKTNNLFNVVFFNILKHSPTPLEDMDELGISDPQYAELIGYSVYQVVDFAPELVDNFQYQVGYAAILKYYARHPDRFLALVERGVQSAFKLRPPALGNFESSISSRYSQSMNTWSDIKGLYFPRSLAFFSLLFAASLGMILVKWLKFDRCPQGPGSRVQRTIISIIHLTILVAALSQFFVVLIGEGETDIVKQLFLFNALLDINLLMLTLYATGWLTRYLKHEASI